MVDALIKERRWGWIGHTLRRPGRNYTKEALDWNPQGSRKRGRPRQTWRRTIQAEAAAEGKSWGEVKALAQDREKWRRFVVALSSPVE